MPGLNADELLDLKQRLIDGLAVLTRDEVMSHGGHLSVRIPGTETFLINPRIPGALAHVENICTVDLSGKRIAGPGPIPSETQIHASVYRHRADANSVLHSHPRDSVLVGLLETGLIPRMAVLALQARRAVGRGGTSRAPSARGGRAVRLAHLNSQL